jgi:hypothetical protein
MRTHTKLAEQHAEQLKQLSAQVAVLSASQSLQENAEKTQKSVVAAITETSCARDENRSSRTRLSRSYDHNIGPEQNPTAGQRGFTSHPSLDGEIWMSVTVHLNASYALVRHVIAAISALLKTEAANIAEN